MGCRLPNADESAAVIDKFLHSCNYSLICPVLAAALGCVCISHIDHNIEVFQKVLICQNVVKADKGNIKGRAA